MSLHRVIEKLCCIHIQKYYIAIKKNDIVLCINMIESQNILGKKIIAEECRNVYVALQFII